MSKRRKTLLRLALSLFIISATTFLAAAFIDSSTTVAQSETTSLSASGTVSDQNITAVSAQGFRGVGNKNIIFAVNDNKRVVFYNDSYDNYFDVDPIPGEEYTLLYVAQQRLNGTDCGGGASVCYDNMVLRHNISTGDSEVLYSQIRPGEGTTDPRWHDVDMIDDNTLLVGDMKRDSVYIVDIRTKTIEFAWNAQAEYPVTGGGKYPERWTHLNDVELLPDDRVMISLRNQDQVAFINRSEGLDEEWTLGMDDNHSILFEQHNPDYIPENRGGPAVLVADSGNNRVVEYQREDGEWRRSWIFADTQLQWPRDADRLPNGNTLIGDSHGNRVIEVNRNGDIVWSIETANTYDVERLNTGDESTGQSADRLGLTSVGTWKTDNSQAETSPTGVVSTIKNILPNNLVNGLLFVIPDWMGLVHVLVTILGSGALGILILFEAYWAGLRVENPIKFK